MSGAVVILTPLNTKNLEIMIRNTISRMFMSLFLIFITFTSLNAQQESFPNGGFEVWNIPNTTTKQPSLDGYHSVNSGYNGGEKSSFYVSRGDSDYKLFGFDMPPKSGNKFGIIKNNGVLSNGYVIKNQTANDFYVSTGTDRKTEFNSKPNSLVGYIRFASGSSDDKVRINIVLHKDKYSIPEESEHENNKIGEADTTLYANHYSDSGTVENHWWIRFAVPFTYSSTDNPEHILISITNLGYEGTEIHLDDFEFIYNGEVSVKDVEVDNFNVFAKGQDLVVDLSSVSLESNSSVSIYDLSGRKIAFNTLNERFVNTLTLNSVSGIYIYEVEVNGVVKTGKLVF